MSPVDRLGLSSPPLVIATNNAAKLREFRRLLAGTAWRVLSPPGCRPAAI